MEQLKATRRAYVKALRKEAKRDACAPRKYGPWTVICDNESFLEAPAAVKAHARANVELWHIPPRSPDFNPVERFWSWVRRRLRKMDNDDLNAKRPPIGKHALQARVKALLKTRAAKRAARNYFASFRSTCVIVDKLKGAHSGR